MTRDKALKLLIHGRVDPLDAEMILNIAMLNGIASSCGHEVTCIRETFTVTADAQ